MRRIYIDSEYRCYTTNPDDAFREAYLSENAQIFFADKCAAFIEGYRLKPEGETWVRSDGQVFSGAEMISPWKDYAELDAAQRQYEQEQLADMRQALEVMGVTLNE